MSVSVRIIRTYKFACNTKYTCLMLQLLLIVSAAAASVISQCVSRVFVLLADDRTVLSLKHVLILSSIEYRKLKPFCHMLPCSHFVVHYAEVSAYTSMVSKITKCRTNRVSCSGLYLHTVPLAAVTVTSTF